MKTDEKQSDISLTGKLGLTSDLTLDATYNPDFSQVEADAGQIDTGFITRTGLRRLSAFAMKRFYPKLKFFQRIEPFYWSAHLYDTNDKMFETFNLFTLRFWLPRTTVLRFDTILSSEVFAGKRFRTSGFGIQGSSQITKQVNVSTFFRHTGSIYY